MKTAWKWLAAGAVCAATALATTGIPAQEPAPDGAPTAAGPVAVEDVPAPEPAESKITDVTVYQGTALVTREVAVPAGRGLVEAVVTPLPPRILPGSLYTEGTDGLRVLSTRFRTRAVKEDTRAEVRAKEEEIRTLQAEAQRIERRSQVLRQDLEFLGKLEGFTSATTQSLVDKGALNDESVIGLTKYVMQSRSEKSTALVDLEQEARANAEALAFAQRQLSEIASGSSRTANDAVILVDKANEAAGAVRLNYLVGSASWDPQYRLRAGAPDEPVRLEYLGAIVQQSGEPWEDARVTLSTAQPSLNATPPDLVALEISVGSAQPGQPGGMGGMGMGMAGTGGGMGGGMGGMGMSLEQYQAQAKAVRGQAQQEMIGNNAGAGGALLNQAAALDQARELLAQEPGAEAGEAPVEGPSVTFKLPNTLTIASRSDPLLVEVARLDMEPEFFDKAVPVLTPRVYRLANLKNTGEHVLLPGEATMYVGTDFVGRMTLPLVASGEQFTVGFGIDPQVQVYRRLTSKSRTVQGGNQVLTYDFRIAVRSFRAEPVKVQVWDRLPKADSEAVAVNLVQTAPALSDDTNYQRNIRPDNLLRWDLTANPASDKEKNPDINYQFKLEYARGMEIDQISSNLRENPIGGGAFGGGGLGGSGGMGGFRSVPEEDEWQ
jgi:hypothetical protein